MLTSTVNSKEAVRALEYWKELVVDFQLTPSSSDIAQMGPDAYFKAGRAAMYIDGTWMAPSIKNASPDFDFKVTSFPKGDVKVSRSISSSFAIAQNSEHPDEAWELIKFLTAKEQLNDYWQALWVAAPARISSMESEAYEDVVGVPDAGVPGIDSSEEFEDKVGYIKDAFDNGWANQEWFSPYQNYYFDEVNNAIQSVLVEGADPEEALTRQRIGLIFLLARIKKLGSEMMSEARAIDQNDKKTIHKKKTGALGISFSCSVYYINLRRYTDDSWCHSELFSL